MHSLSQPALSATDASALEAIIIAVHRTLLGISIVGLATFAALAVAPHWALWMVAGSCLVLRWIEHAFLRHLTDPRSW